MRKQLKYLTKKMIALIFAMFFTIGLMPAAFAEGEDTRDLTNVLTDLHVDMSLKKSDGATVPIIVDNEKDAGFNEALVSGSTILFGITWTLEEADFYGQVKAGDYFTIDLPSDYFTFRDTTLNTPLTYNGETLGHWGVRDNKIQFTLTDTGAQKRYIKGHFNASGTLKANESGDVVIEIGDVALPPVPVEPSTPAAPDPGVDFPYEHSNPPAQKPISKNGSTYAGSEAITWSIPLNYDNMVTAAVHTSPALTPLKNAVVEDTLEKDQTIKSVSIQTVFYRPRNAAGELSTQWGATISVKSQFTELNQENGESPDAFKARVKGYGSPAYGVSADKKYLIISLGDVPGNGVKMAADDTALRAKFKASNSRLTDAELDAMVKSWGTGGIAGGQAVGYYITIQAETGRAYEQYSNTATLTTSDKAPAEASKSVTLEDLQGGIEAGEPHSVRLEKRSAENGNPLENAAFQLEVLRDGVYVPYVPADGGGQIRATGPDGVVEFRQLGSGTYRFVETAAAPGYDKDSVTYSPETFTISSEDTQGVVVTATNLLLPEEPVDPALVWGSVELSKVDQADPQKTLKNAGFRLYERQEDGSVLYYKDANNGLPLWSADPAGAQTFTTDDQGVITAVHLPLGTYYFEEITPPEGYALSETPLAFTLDEHSTEAAKKVVFENARTSDPANPAAPAGPAPQKPGAKGAQNARTAAPGGANPKTGLADVSAALGMLVLLSGSSAGLMILRRKK